MNLRIAIKIALGIAILQNPVAGISLQEKNTLDVVHDKFYSGELNTREGISNLQEIMERSDTSLGEDPFPLFHAFSEGLYTREMHAPKGYFIIGKIHRHEHLVHLTKGSLLVADEFGTKMIEAPATFVSKKGIKRVGYTISDVVWIDIHKTDANNVKDAEKDIFVSTYEELDLENNVIDTDYIDMVDEIGLTVNKVRALSEGEGDMIFDEQKNIEIKPSPIQGKGVFVTKNFKEGDIVGVARKKDKRTLVGRYTNHDENPNTISDIDDENAVFVATKEIESGDEITIDYRNAIKTSKQMGIKKGELCQA